MESICISMVRSVKTSVKGKTYFIFFFLRKQDFIKHIFLSCFQDKSKTFFNQDALFEKQNDLRVLKN